MENTSATFDALCIDTCIYESQGMTFERGLLKQLDQFLESPIALLVPEIVHFELQSHLSNRVSDARVKVARAVRIAGEELFVNEETLRQAEQMLLGDTSDLGQRKLSEFYTRSGAVVLNSSKVVMARLVDMYFSSKPPFESSGKKKAEFPDAIALLSLEEWANEHDGKVLVVSSDTGWHDFCAASDRLFMAQGLGEALAHFQPHNLAATLIRQLQAQLTADTKGGINEYITAEIARFVERQAPEAEATSTYVLDEQYVSAEYVSHEFHLGNNFEPEINVVRVSSDGLVLQLYASVTCEITAEYRLSVYDSIDRERIPLQKRKVSTSTKFDADLIVKIVGDFRRGLSHVDVQEIEVEGALNFIELGDIDPDPEQDEWDKERYTY